MKRNGRSILTAIGAAAIMVVYSGIAVGQSPHFLKANASLDGTDLVVTWKEAGLGSNLQISYTASADGTAVYACINNGGRHPKASNKTTIAGPVSASAVVTSGKNGSITGTLTVHPPPSPDFCPSGQTFILAYVSYSNIAITDETNNIVASASPSSFSACLVSGSLAAELCP